MNKQERVLNNMKADKKLTSKINKMSYTEVETVYESALRYVKAIKEGRIICNIETVSSSGMSRTIKFLECRKEKGRNYHHYCNFWTLFKALGFEEVKNKNTFRIHGCGMDMIFHTNYTIIHRLEYYGLISKKQCERLAQQTPQVI